MPYTYYLGTGDSPIDQPISTGLACHSGWAAATASAICEAVERDAVMIAWQAMLAPPQIRVETLSDECYDLVQRLERPGGRVVLLDITLDHGIPSVLGCLLGTARGPALVVAGSSDLSAEQAVRKSLEELAHTHRFCQYVRTRMPLLVPDPPEYEVVRDQLTHLAFYVDPANLHHAEFLWASRERRSFDELADHATGSPAGDVEELTRRIAAVGERVLACDLTTPDVRPLGLRVVRAIVPGFQPLHMGYGLRALGGRRLWEVPRRLGWPGVAPETGDNPAPHPYP
jgi:ribosomal protein S12 methylthiotransferase accessory factor